MNYTNKLIGMFALMLATLICFNFVLESTPAQLAENPPVRSGKHSFGDKILVVSYPSPTETPGFLIDATLEEIGGRTFLKGKSVVPSLSAWSGFEGTSGSEVGIAWDTVYQYQAFTKEQFESYQSFWENSYNK